MVDLTARQKFILNAIIEKGPLSIKDLSQQVDVSTRTISRDILVINKLLISKNINILEENSKLNIQGSEEDVKDLQRSLGGIPLQWLLTQEQRLLLITAQLLVSEEPYKSAYFSYQFNVVEGTISFYMDKIEQWLNIHNLSLNKKRGYGLIISGAEWKKRNSFVELLYEYKPINELLAFIYGNKYDPAINAFFKTVFGEELIQISRDLLELIHNEVAEMDDIAYFSSFMHILLSLKKIKLGHPIQLPSYLVQDILSANEFSMIREIKKYLQSLNIEITDDELAYMAIQLVGNRYIYKTDGKFGELGIGLEELAAEVVYEVREKLNIELEYDDQLILGLSQHFSSALYRINMGIHVKNILITQIKEYYGDLFKAVGYACKLVFSKFNITLSQDEIGYITMHIGAAIERKNQDRDKLSVLIICPNGMGTARILSNKLKSLIPRIGSIEISSFKEWSFRNKEYDLIISTVDIDQGNRECNIITVSPFLQRTDIDKINDFIKLRTSDDRLFTGRTLLDVENDEDFKKNKFREVDNIVKNLQLELIDVNSFNELIKAITEDLYNKEIIKDKEEIEYLIFKREEIGSVVIPDCHVALLHTRSDVVKNPMVGVFRTSNSIFLKNNGHSEESVDTFIVLLARRNEDAYVLEQMGKISIALIENKEFTEILRLGDIKDLRNYLITTLNEEES